MNRMSHASEELRPYESIGIESCKLGMWLFLASEVMFFTGLIGAYIVVRQSVPDWPVPGKVLNIPLTAFNSFLLFCSSFTLVKSLASARKNDSKGIQAGLFFTILLGSFFLAIQAYEYRELIQIKSITPSASLFGACFFTLTGFHAFHVLGGVLYLLFVFMKSLRGAYAPAGHRGIEVAGLYWHFVGFVWAVLFTIIYLL